MTPDEHKAAYDKLHYPGEEPRVLVNTYGYQQEEFLALKEAEKTAERYRQPLPPEAREITADGFKAIHRHLFQDSYDWAGETRPYASARDASTPFAMPEVIAEKLTAIFDRLHEDNNLRGLSASAFAEKAADTIGELNAAHPFVEGNGRTQRVFLKTLAEQAGHKYEITQADRNDWNSAAKLAFVEFDNAPMAALIEKRLTPTAEPEPLAPARILPDLPREDIDVQVNMTVRVADARSSVRLCSDAVYGDANATDGVLRTIETGPAGPRELGKDASANARFTPEAVAPLAGAEGRRGPDPRRQVALEAVPDLANAIGIYGNARADAERDIRADHQTRQIKASRELPAPSAAYAGALAATPARQAELFADKRLRDEHTKLTAAFASRLTVADNQALRAGDAAALSKSLGVTATQATKITQVRTQMSAADPVVRAQARTVAKTVHSGRLVGE